MSEDIKGLVERLTLNVPCFDSEGNKRKKPCGYDGGLCPECRKKQDAADAIEAMAGEVKRLQELLLYAHESIDGANDRLCAVDDIEDAADARVRAAVAEVVKVTEDHDALREKIDSIGSCACAYDKAGYVCSCHSPVLKRAIKLTHSMFRRMKQATKDERRLREVINTAALMLDDCGVKEMLKRTLEVGKE